MKIKKNIFFTTFSMLALALFCILMPRNVHAGLCGCNGGSLPENINKFIHNSFNGWRVVTLSDLSADDQSIWKRSFKSTACPGYIVGKFKGKGGIYYAITLIKNNADGTFQQTLVLASKNFNERVVVLSKPDKVDRISVVELMPSGKYYDNKSDNNVAIPNDAIGFETIEAGQIIYYWNGKTFIHFISSE